MEVPLEQVIEESLVDGLVEYFTGLYYELVAGVTPATLIHPIQNGVTVLLGESSD